MTRPDSDSDQDRKQQQPLSLREVVGSIMAALLGVQSSRNHARDFARGTAKQYIVVGLVATILFVNIVYFAVKLILHLAAG
ncbi:MAG: DUF2970 domain-containing protein [Gammaproteobacteria bacterium]|nr:DUF2970 domain-containing protein [Gammaproteobacteria bacterium]